MNIDNNQPLRFDEQFAQTYPIATLSLDIAQLVANNPLLVFQDSYDDLDFLRYCILNIPSESKVALVCHERSPLPGVDICIDPQDRYSSSILGSTLRNLGLTPQNLRWVHPELKLPQKVLHKNEELLGGRYRIEERLGNLTYKAVNTTLDTFFTLRFKDINESDENFDASVKMLMNFKDHNNIAYAIMKWTDEDEDGNKLLFIVQEYLEGVDTFNDYLLGKNGIRLKHIKLIEVTIVLATLYERMRQSGSVMEIDKSNILIHSKGVKITYFGQPIAEYSKNLLDLISNALKSLQISDGNNLSRREKESIKQDLFYVTEFENEMEDIDDSEYLSILKEKLKKITSKVDKLQENNSFHEFEKCIEDFYRRLENIGSTNIELQDLINELNRVKAIEEESMKNLSIIKGVVKSFEQFIDNLVKNDDLNQVWQPTEERIFYATLLFRSIIDEDEFVRIYFGKYKKNLLYSYSDWEKDGEFLTKEKLLVSNSCAGFPIIWHETIGRIELEKEKRIKFDLNVSDSESIKYVLARDVKKARSENGIISQKYQKAGWNLTTKDGKNDGEVSDDVDCTITIPVYKPYSIGNKFILAVAHFELIQVLEEEELVKIAESLSSLVHNKLEDIIHLFHTIS